MPLYSVLNSILGLRNPVGDSATLLRENR